MRRILFILPVCIALACDSGTGTGKTGDGKTGDGKTGDGKTGGGGAAAPANKPLDPYEIWGKFGVGSMIEVEMEASGMKTKTIKTLDTKGGDEHVLKTEMIMKVGDQEMKTPGEEKVPKPKTGGAADGNCPLCSKAFKDHKDESKWSEETVKVGDKDVKCKVMASADKNCKGEATPDAQKMKIWYSEDVPGGMVKMEMATMKQSVVKFEKK